MLKKGFVFSIDALIALIVATVLIGASFFYINQVQTVNWSHPNIFIVSMDTLNTLREDDSLVNAVENGPEDLNNFFNVMYPSNLCGNLELREGDGTLVVVSSKNGCDKRPSAGEDVNIARRTFVYEKHMYYAVLRTWYT